VKSRTRLGREKPFYVFRHCLIAMLRMHQIPIQQAQKAQTGIELLPELL